MALTFLFFSSLVFAASPVLAASIISPSAASPLVTATIAVHDQDEFDYSELAKISMGQAIRAARLISNGKLIESSLEKHNDFLVYRVDFNECTKRLVRIYIDAGNGAFLEKEFPPH